MKSMTIHGIDDQLAELLRSKAESEGLSMNKTIKKLLDISLGIKPASPCPLSMFGLRHMVLKQVR